jgi:hypothetical protein
MRSDAVYKACRGVALEYVVGATLRLGHCHICDTLGVTYIHG